MITPTSIENLKNNLDIVDVVSQFIELKKNGANFKACCPFHGEKTPSFVVSPQKQIFHCFGCGIGGDAIKFVMEYEKLSYPQTLEKLSGLYNIPLEYDNEKQKQDLTIIKKLNHYYQKLLFSNENVKKYLKTRGVSMTSIEKFEIGYAPKSSQTLEYLKSNLFNLGDAKEFGLIDSGENGLYARFIDRITFPIYSINSNLVGFGGRTISGHNAKYINSPQTKIFNKSKLLYGYHLAKQDIYKQKQIIITEGYLDVVMLHQAGFTTTVATLGTALTKEHIPILARIEAKIILAYDGDNAGKTAAYKASLLLGEFSGGVVIFKDGLDPADMVKENKIEDLNNMFRSPISFINYVIEYIIDQYDLVDPQQKQKALNETNNYLKTLNPLLQEEYASYIARVLNVKEQYVQVQKFDNSRVSNLSLSNFDLGELSIIRSAISDDTLYKMVTQDLHSEMFEVHKKEFELLLENKDHEHLRGLLVDERLKILSQEELKQQILYLGVPFFTKKLQELMHDQSLNFKKKTRAIRTLQDKLKQLKK